MNIELLLRNWNYEQAKDFYLQHGENQTVIRMLSGIKNSYVEKRLRQELQKLQQHTDNQVFSKLVVTQNSSVENKPQSTEIQEITSRWKRNYKKASRLQMTLTQAPNDEARKAMAFEILELMDSVHDDWDNLAYYEQHGTFLPTQIKINLPNLDKADLMQRLRTLRTYLTPSKSKIYSEEQKQVFQAEISEIEKALIEIDTH